MKKLFTLLFTGASFLGLAQTQAPNAGFETWSSVSFESINYLEPTPWAPGEACASIQGQAACSFSGTQSTDAHSGNYALGVQNDGIFGNLAYDIALTGRPTSVSFWVKTNLKSGTKLSFIALASDKTLFEDDTDNDAEASIEIDNIYTDYTQVSVDFVYTSQDDLNYLSFIIGIDPNNGTADSFATIDDIVVYYGNEGEATTTAIRDHNKSILKIANPVSEDITLPSTVINYSLYSANGVAIQSGSGDTVSVSELVKGIYVLRYSTSDGEFYSHKFVVE